MSEHKLVDEIVALRAENEHMRSTLKLVLAGLHNGSVKSKPLLPFDPDAETLEMQSLEQIVSAALKQ